VRKSSLTSPLRVYYSFGASFALLLLCTTNEFVYTARVLLGSCARSNRVFSFLGRPLQGHVVLLYANRRDPVAQLVSRTRVYVYRLRCVHLYLRGIIVYVQRPRGLRNNKTNESKFVPHNPLSYNIT